MARLWSLDLLEGTPFFYGVVAAIVMFGGVLQWIPICLYVEVAAVPLPWVQSRSSSICVPFSVEPFVSVFICLGIPVLSGGWRGVNWVGPVVGMLEAWALAVCQPWAVSMFGDTLLVAWT